MLDPDNHVPLSSFIYENTLILQMRSRTSQMTGRCGLCLLLFYGHYRPSIGKPARTLSSFLDSESFEDCLPLCLAHITPRTFSRAEISPPAWLEDPLHFVHGRLELFRCHGTQQSVGKNEVHRGIIDEAQVGGGRSVGFDVSTTSFIRLFPHGSDRLLIRIDSINFSFGTNEFSQSESVKTRATTQVGDYLAVANVGPN